MGKGCREVFASRNNALLPGLDELGKIVTRKRYEP